MLVGVEDVESGDFIFIIHIAGITVGCCNPEISWVAIKEFRISSLLSVAQILNYVVDRFSFPLCIVECGIGDIMADVVYWFVKHTFNHHIAESYSLWILVVCSVEVIEIKEQ